MSYLLYGVFSGTAEAAIPDVTGVDQQCVKLLLADGLGAIVSEHQDAVLSQETTHLLAYQQVIDTHYQQYAVIPMRYGCLFETEAAVLRHLVDHQSSYLDLLQKIDGCVEMGIRFLMQEETIGGANNDKSDESPGRAFLKTRQQYYEKTGTDESAGHQAGPMDCGTVSGGSGLLEARIHSSPASGITVFPHHPGIH